MVWRLGFFDEVELRLSEGGMPWLPKLSEGVAMLAKLHSTRFLRRLVLGGSASDYRPALKNVIALPRTLRSLCVTGQLWGEYTPGEHRIGNLAPLCRAHPQLEQLDIKINKEPLDGLTLPGLRELYLWTNQLSPSQLAALARAPWPKLHTLEVAVGTAATAKPADVAALLSAKTFPALKTLRLGVLPDEAYATELAKRVAKLKLDAIVLVNCDYVAEAFKAASHVPVSTAERET